MRALALFLVACGGSSTPAVDAGPDGPPALVAPAGQWTYLPQANTTCGDGSPAGLALNPAPAATTDLIVYFEGGGACWDATTCFQIKSAIRIDTPYDDAAFQSELPGIQAFGPFQRTGTPFAGANMAYVPYCTGDVHDGTAVQQYTFSGQQKTVHHTGGTNAVTFASLLHSTYPDAKRIWIMGSSAGGYGATLQLPTFASTWPDAEVHVLQDSALFVPDMLDATAKLGAWQLMLPPGVTSQADVMPALETQHPTTRIGLLTYDDDATLEAFEGYAKGTLAAAIDTLVANAYAKPSTHVFELAGSTHTMLGSYATLAGPGGVKLSDWVAQWATGDAAWTTVK